MAKTSTTVTPRSTRAARERQLQRGTRRGADRSPISWNIPWTTVNFIGIGLGIVVIAIGYMLMGTAIAEDPVRDKSIWNNANATSLAPVILTIGYCIILPVAIFWRRKDDAEETVRDAAE